MLQAGARQIGLVCVAGVVAASMTMNFLFGYGFGTTPLTSWVWGGLSVAVDGLKAVLPGMIAEQWAARRWLRTGLGLLMMAVVVGYALTSAMGFAGHSRRAHAADIESAQASFVDAKADLARAEARSAALGPQRPPEAVRADLVPLERDPLWEASKSCQERKTSAQRQHCRRVDEFTKEAVRASESAGLREQIAKLRAELKSARERGGGEHVADLQASALAWLVGRDAQGAAVGLTWLAALLVELVSSFGLLVVDAPMGRQSAKLGQRPAWRLVAKADGAGAAMSHG
jgi:hypothetical protein